MFVATSLLPHEGSLRSSFFLLAFAAFAVWETFRPRRTLASSTPRRWARHALLWFLSSAAAGLIYRVEQQDGEQTARPKGDDVRDSAIRKGSRRRPLPSALEKRLRWLMITGDRRRTERQLRSRVSLLGPPLWNLRSGTGRGTGSPSPGTARDFPRGGLEPVFHAPSALSALEQPDFCFCNEIFISFWHQLNENRLILG